LVALLLFVGAAGKSAQFPLHIWLPDAMEGPTPVSALIHAATMVAAGVFLVARTWPLFEASADARLVILIIGAFTALASATIAVAQTDIKKVLAYSTISQLGFMFAALGAGAWVAAVFHLATHAAFKALLFLGSGSVIHGADTQDMREMGGLRKMMPWTTATWIIGSLALAGVPPLAGFWSKDEVIHAVLSNSPIAGAALVVASLLTAFYITRATRLTFFGEYRGTHHPHESGWSMRVALLALAVPAAIAGFFGHGIAELLGEHAESLDPLTAAISIGVAAAGIAIGWTVYRDGAESEERMQARFGGLWSTLRAAYGFDSAVRVLVIDPVLAVSAWLYEVFDRRVIDGIAEGVGTVTARAGSGVSRIQYGDTQWYVSLLGAGAVLTMVITIVDWAVLWSWLAPLLGVGS
jgi:NADH-quinone oxidoreductase subunit L